MANEKTKVKGTDGQVSDDNLKQQESLETDATDLKGDPRQGGDINPQKEGAGQSDRSSDQDK